MTMGALQSCRLRVQPAGLSADLNAPFPNIAWQQPSRLRNRIVHGYWSIDLEVLRTTATDQLPAFTGDPRRVLAPLSKDRT